MGLISIFKTPVIEFLCDESLYGVIPEPYPAGRNMPDWFKKVPPYSKTNRDTRGHHSMNAKKCIPMIDAMTLGFTIPLFSDQHVRSNSDCSIVEIGPTSTEFPRVVERHDIEQVGGRSDLFKHDPIKFINPWVIKTAPGWSTLFVPCLNSFETRFACLSGMVDTDKYVKQVNFPGVWLQPNYDDYLPAGTPLVTVIPIKRSNIQEDYKVRTFNDSEKKEIERIRRCQESRLHYYTKELRESR